MKKFLLFSLLLIVSLIISITTILVVFEDRIVDSFKKEIIDKTNINLDYSHIHFSVFSTFPLCSFDLDNASIRYSFNRGADTLLFSKKVRFKINVVNIFKGIYEFPEIAISDGQIDLIKEKLDSLFPKEFSAQNDRPNTYFLKSDKIKISRCRIKWISNGKVNLKIHIQNLSCSGSFLPNKLALRLSFTTESLTGNLKNHIIMINNQLSFSGIIKEKDNCFYSENAVLKFNSIKQGIYFIYSQKEDFLQAKLFSNDISIKELNLPVFEKINRYVSKGTFSFNSNYSVNMNDLESQKLSVSYELKNFQFFLNKNLTIRNLKGTTILIGKNVKNTSEINEFSIKYTNLEFSGTAKIKDIPKPYVIVDAKVKNTGAIDINNNLNFKGNISGELKFLIKIDDIYKLTDSTLKIIKLKSNLTVSNLSFEKIDAIKNMAGTLQFDENRFSFKGNGKLYNSTFYGNIEIPDYLSTFVHHQVPNPNIFITVDRLNLDSLLTESKDSKAYLPNSFRLNGKVKRLIYKGCEINNLGLTVNGSDGKYISNQFSMNAFSGSIAGNFSYSNSDGFLYSIIFQNIDIHNLFKTFNNFEQTIITSDNIYGSLSGNAGGSFKYNNLSKIDPSSLKIASKLLIEKGELHDLKHFERLSKFLNLKEIESVKFKTLVNTINIENGVVNIPAMNISSSALSFQLAGQHSFTGEFTYWLKLNLKEVLAKKFLIKNKNNLDYEKDNEKGISLFLKLYGNSENYKLTLDRKGSLTKLKNNFKEEGNTLKQILKEEFNLSEKNNMHSSDSATDDFTNKVDTNHNKKKKIPFKIEWDEIDSTKSF